MTAVEPVRHVATSDATHAHNVVDGLRLCGIRGKKKNKRDSFCTVFLQTMVHLSCRWCSPFLTGGSEQREGTIQGTWRGFRNRADACFMQLVCVVAREKEKKAKKERMHVKRLRVFGMPCRFAVLFFPEKTHERAARVWKEALAACRTTQKNGYNPLL